MKLQIEMIPRSAWGKNLRTKLKPQRSWDTIRKSVYAKENMHCNICGDKCATLDAHELWEFDETKHIQKLVNIIGICKPCHNTIHFGLAQKLGKEKEAIDQFMKVNNCLDYFEFEMELERAKSDFFRRSKIENWELDLSFIERLGYEVKKD